MKKSEYNMSAEDFCRMLRGYFEFENPESIGPEQTKEIKEHLDKVFLEVVPANRVQVDRPGVRLGPASEALRRAGRDIIDRSRAQEIGPGREVCGTGGRSPGMIC